MKITQERFYDGAEDKIKRLGLSNLFSEVKGILSETQIFLLEEPEANGSKPIRLKIDSAFAQKGGWIKKVVGGVDWIKEAYYNKSVTVRLGVEIQVSNRSDLVIRDIVHLRNSLQSGEIDAGVIVVPDKNLPKYTASRSPTYRETIKYIEEEFKEAMTFPIAPTVYLKLACAFIQMFPSFVNSSENIFISFWSSLQAYNTTDGKVDGALSSPCLSPKRRRPSMKHTIEAVLIKSLHHSVSVLAGTKAIPRSK